jgi:hypothetical protein
MVIAGAGAGELLGTVDGCDVLITSAAAPPPTPTDALATTASSDPTENML